MVAISLKRPSSAYGSATKVRSLHIHTPNVHSSPAAALPAERIGGCLRQLPVDIALQVVHHLARRDGRGGDGGSGEGAAAAAAATDAAVTAAARKHFPPRGLGWPPPPAPAVVLTAVEAAVVTRRAPSPSPPLFPRSPPQVPTPLPVNGHPATPPPQSPRHKRPPPYATAPVNTVLPHSPSSASSAAAATTMYRRRRCHRCRRRRRRRVAAAPPSQSHDLYGIHVCAAQPLPL